MENRGLRLKWLCVGCRVLLKVSLGTNHQFADAMHALRYIHALPSCGLGNSFYKPPPTRFHPTDYSPFPITTPKLVADILAPCSNALSFAITLNNAGS